jgi:hypothetical protein
MVAYATVSLSRRSVSSTIRPACMPMIRTTPASDVLCPPGHVKRPHQLHMEGPACQPGLDAGDQACLGRRIVVAWEQEPKNHLKFAYYASWTDLLAGATSRTFEARLADVAGLPSRRGVGRGDPTGLPCEIRQRRLHKPGDRGNRDQRPEGVACQSVRPPGGRRGGRGGRADLLPDRVMPAPPRG